MVAVLIALLALSASLWQSADACAANVGGCTPAVCKAVGKIRPSKSGSGPLFGFFYGVWNKDLSQSLEYLPRKQGGPVVNYEAFTEVGYLLPDGKGYGKATSLGACCSECAATPGCKVYQFFGAAEIKKSGRKGPKGYVAGVQCYLLVGGSDKTDNKEIGLPYSGPRSEQANNEKKVFTSWVGGLCNPDPKVVDDPHFVGALGTKFDFNGELNKPFCLISDKTVHVNVLLKGYKDDSVEKGVRSWIKEVGLLWTDAAGMKHSAHLVARNGKQQGRGAGFISALEIDNAKVVPPARQGEVVTAPDFTLSFVGVEKLGPYEVEHLVADVAGVAKLNIRIRVAHAMLQTPTDAEAHFNIEVSELRQSKAVHGVLGQTFRSTAVQVKKAMRYSELSELLHAPVRADGESGKGFLDGTVADYEASSVLTPDCHFASFGSLEQ